jgi:hypothetical protein
MINYPVYKYKINGGRIETSLPRNLLKFYDGDKPYYISQFNHIGQYFDSFPSGQLSTFVAENDISRSPASLKYKYIAPYEKFLSQQNKSTKIQLTSPEQAGFSTDAAKSCIKERLREYVTIMMFRSHAEDFPYTNEINADLQEPDRSSLRHKYIKTSDEIKASLRNKIINTSSACSGVIDDNDFDKSFEKAYGNRINNYNKYREYFIR